MTSAPSSGALTRYRVMAYVTGVVLATSCLLGLSFWPWYVGEGAAGWLWTAHGYLYIVYVVTAFLLALKARWSVVKTLLVMARRDHPAHVVRRGATSDGGPALGLLITLPLLQRRPPEHGPPEEHGRGREQPPLQGVGEVPPARHAATTGGRRDAPAAPGGPSATAAPCAAPGTRRTAAAGLSGSASIRVTVAT